MARHIHGIVFAAVAFVSVSSILVRLSVAPSLVIAAWRMIIAAVLLAGVPLVFREGRDGAVKMSRPSVRDVLLLIASGILLALHFAAWVTSLSLTSVVHSTVLVTAHPAIVLVASAVIFRQKVDRKRLAATVVALAGAVLLAGGGSVSGRQPTPAGDLLAFAGAVAIAGYFIIGGYLRRSLSAGWYNSTVHAVAAAALVGATVVFGQPLGPYPLREYLIFAALAVFCTILGHSMLNWALKYVSASDVSLAVLLEPVFASILAAILFHEIPGGRTVLGAVVVLGSLAYVRVSQRE